MYRFLVTASILVLLGFIYLGQRIVAPNWPPSVRWALWVLLGLMIANLLWLPFKRWRRTAAHASHRSTTSWPTRLAEASAYAIMGFLSLLLIFSVISEVIRLVFKVLPADLQAEVVLRIPAGQNLESLLSLLIIGCALVAFSLGRWNVASGPRYRFVKLVLPLHGKPRRRPRFRRHQPATKKIRLVQVSDLHIGRAIKKEYVRKVVDMINAQSPDLACFTGDIGDGYLAQLKEDAAPLAGIRAKHGTYYVPGNHEYYWGIDSWLKEFSALGMKILLNRGETVQTDAAKLFIGGVSDPTAARFASEPPRIPQPAAANFSLLLVHQPLFVRSAAAAGYDLMLAGHTHGGQYIPWSWVVHLFFRFAKGLYRYRDLLVYVNDGTGYWGAPLRIGTRPEITVIDVYLTEGKPHHA